MTQISDVGRQSDGDDVTTDEPVPVVEDLSGYILGGRADPAFGVAQAVEAERLGLRRVWVNERLDLKNAGVLLGAIGASTSRLGAGVMPMTSLARSPIVTASIGSTLHNAFGPRFTLGLGRGATDEWVEAFGVGEASYSELVDYANVVKGLLRGEEVTYEGSFASYRNVSVIDAYDGPPPEIWFATLGGPKSSRVAAQTAFDGTMLTPLMTVDAVARSVEETRRECERIGRDPATLRICAGVAAAPPPPSHIDVSNLPASMTNPAYGNGLVTPAVLKGVIALTCTEYTGYLRRNGWDTALMDRIVGHSAFQSGAELSSTDRISRDRTKFQEAGDLVPDSWLRDCALVGSIDDCVQTLQSFRDAGADEIALYFATPAQCADLIAAWRDHQTAAASQPGSAGC
ncbi:LLM class F420-dependent oxidoreductase [Mycobacterium marseillense]|uniref:LLM class F420-dependent oxidoreductase n=2 Tax=Mycobacterium avium complex (MAC) TaxID=120793 RepID=A0ABN5ZV91_9MYCO|nr:LLM class F420-dependent oxidoreductase [Mycobacterium marseillense]BBY12567.1 LLM class F420-dependent oxidoreductase [Mycobacterium marseillense]